MVPELTLPRPNPSPAVTGRMVSQKLPCNPHHSHWAAYRELNWGFARTEMVCCGLVQSFKYLFIRNWDPLWLQKSLIKVELSSYHCFFSTVMQPCTSLSLPLVWLHAKPRKVEPAAAENSSDLLIEKYHQSTRHELAIFHHDGLDTRKLILTADRWPY
jgi:hypothetical protein